VHGNSEDCANSERLLETAEHLRSAFLPATIAPAVAELRVLTPSELAEYRKDLATASDDHPNIPFDRAALALLDELQHEAA
jgi:hypothetical protein